MAVHLTLDGETHSIEILRRKPHLELLVDGRRHVVRDLPEATVARLSVDGETFDVACALTTDGARETCFVRIDGRTHEIGLIDPREEAAGGDAGRLEIHAPMPGAVVAVHKHAGDTVARGETVLVIESMKLQTALVAPTDGRLVEVLKRAGETFDKDELLARLADED